MPGTSRPRVPNYGGASANEDNAQSAQSALGQGFSNTTTTPGWGSIWNNNPLGSTFTSAIRDTSRPRENSRFANVHSEIEGMTGSGSLVASSESDGWNSHRSPWGAAESSNVAMPHPRSSGVSPARNRNIANTSSSQPFADNASSSYLPVSRPPAVGQASMTRTTNTLLDPTTVNFSSARQVEPATNGYSAFNRFAEPEVPAQRMESLNGSRPDGDALHSPTDDRRSNGNSEYFGASSSTPSRSGSLPPSRHGAEPAQFQQGSDNFSRFAPPRAHNPSYSQANGRPFPERNGSIQSDSLNMLRQLSVDHDTDAGMMLRRPSASVTGLPPQFTPSANESTYPRDALADLPNSLLRQENSSFGGSGAYTPDSYGNGPMNEATAQLRNFQFNSRSAPNGNSVRQSPHHSTAHTPPVFDHLYPSRIDAQQVDRRLRGVQLQQEQPNFLHPQNFQSQHYPHMLTANHFRNPYNGYPYGMPNGMSNGLSNGITNAMQFGGLPPNVSVPGLPGVVPMIDAPLGPRDVENGEGFRSRCLQEFKNNSKTTKRYDLKDIYDHIVEFSGDQHGSRFIQQKLETANSDEKERVFKELEKDTMQLMQDVFGNYVIQKFFEHGDQTQKKVLADKMKGHVLALSLQMYGCRVVQKALEHVLTDQQASLVKELEKDVLKCVKDQNGNHVIQKAIERVPATHIPFIIQAFHGNVGSLATHGYGCRVIQRMLEHCDGDTRKLMLEELHAEGSRLISDQYGNYVTQHIIEHGSPDDRTKIIELVKASLLQFSKHKFASNVVEKCLTFGTEEQRREIMLKVAEKPLNERLESNLFSLMKDGYGNYVIQKLLDTLAMRDFFDLCDALQPELVKARKVISGKQIQAVEKKMHRFDHLPRSDSAQPLPTKRTSVSSTTLSTDTSPTGTPLTSDAQSPQSTSLPSADASAVEEPVNTGTKQPYLPNAVAIANNS